ncbi:hypothetical protein B0H66DRAFT_603913 [Apodospora peruviana]|uniref:Uncharacterized protein n=1 Tax=Apodospora peruviana TaxID=516989 RepID=A0AAE0I6E7_9PEZI|nr:hypothetical protein B0H66DRAFT_603913 [Apodospora peruviana]
MQQRISWPRGNFLRDEALGETAQWEWRQEGMSDRDRKQLRRDPLPFNGDDDNLYGYYVQDVIRRWGYVMWDAWRLERTGAKELLMRQWEEDWGDSNPRDNLL